MGKIIKDRVIYGGIDSALQNKVGSAPLDTTAQDLSGAVNELKASGGGGNVDDVYVNGVSVLDSNKIAQINVPTYMATGNININQQNVISRKEVWLNSMSDYNALSSVDPDTDYHVKGIFAITFSANKVIISDNNGNLVASNVTTEKLNQVSDLTEAYRVVNGELYVVYDDGL